MSYELNDEQVSIIEDVLRDRTAKDSKASEYLCVNIECIMARRLGIEVVDEDDDAKDNAVAMQNAIHTALDDYSSMFIYLRRTVADFENMHPKRQSNYSAMARDAWLQKMIETRKIA